MLFQVALLAEGVDRNMIDPSGVVHVTAVALLAEGVDRNQPPPAPDDTPEESPSSRRAWIEITCLSFIPAHPPVALLAEGVDRNISGS